MSRFSALAHVLPLLAFAALAEAVERWWDDFIAIWSPDERRSWKDAQRHEFLDANLIDTGIRGGFAAGSGGDEG